MLVNVIHPFLRLFSLPANERPDNLLPLGHELMLICFRTFPIRKHLHNSLVSLRSGISYENPGSFAVRPAFLSQRRPFSLSAGKHDTEDGRNPSFVRGRADEKAVAYEGYLPRNYIPSAPKNPDAWLSVIEPMLPRHLRDSHQDFIKDATFTRYLPQILVRARRSFNVDILSYLGVKKGRWRAVVWLAKQVIDRNYIAEETLSPRSNSANVQWSFVDVDYRRDADSSDDPRQTSQSWSPHATLEEISRLPVWFENNGQRHDLKIGALEQETQRIDIAADTGLYILRKIAVGQIWRSLATMILAADEEADADKSSIMPHVLEVIAHLHHVGMIPDAVYEYSSTLSDYTLKQPPLFRLLSSRILTALSDAVWQAHELEVNEAKKTAGAQYSFLDYEIPGSRYRTPGITLGTEVWLEFVLWSCLHGGWVEDGTGILQAIRAKRGDKHEWRLMCWQDVVSMHKAQNSDPIDWSTVGRRIDVPLAKVSKEEHRKGRARVKRKLSSEVVVAYIDALVSSVQVGVGRRGIPASLIIQNILDLKAFLDANELGLGAASWDALIIRLIESQGIDAEEDPMLIRYILTGLSSGYGDGLKAQSPTKLAFHDPEKPTYIFDGTAAALGLYHRALRAFINRGDVDGAFKIFMSLQDHTDRNKQKAIKEFVRDQTPKDFFDQRIYMPETPASIGSLGVLDRSRGESNATNLNTDFPAFFPRVPNPVSGSLLNLITASETFDFGKYLVSSQDIDGPIIPESTYSDPTLAGPLIRLATATQDHGLLMKVSNALRSNPSSTTNTEHADKQNELLPEEVIHAFLENQIRVRKWEAVESLLDHIRDASDLDWNPVQLAQLAREMLLHGTSMSEILHSPEGYMFYFKADRDLQNNANALSLVNASRIFVGLATGRWGSRDPLASSGVLTSLLGLMADLGPHWAQLVRGVRKFKRSQKLHLPDDIFHPVLEGVVAGQGAKAGMRLVKKWCAKHETRSPFLGEIKENGTNKQVAVEEMFKEIQGEDVGEGREGESRDEDLREDSTSTRIEDDADVEEDKEFASNADLKVVVNASDQANAREPTIFDGRLIRRDGGVPAMSRTRPVRAEGLRKAINVLLYEKLGVTISFRGKRPTNLLTLRIVLKGAQKEWKEMLLRQEESGLDEDETRRDLEEIFVWVRDSFRKLGLDEGQIAMLKVKN